MAYYRFFSVSGSGRVVGVQECEAVDDIAALEAALELCTFGAIEIWTGPRRVAQLARSAVQPRSNDV